MIEEESRVIILDRGDYTTLAVNLFGGVITSWKIEHKEQIFKTILTQYTTLRDLRSVWSGITCVFPRHFKWEFGPTFGFLQCVLWKLEEAPRRINDVGDVYAKFSVTDDDYTQSFWKFSFKLHLEIFLLETAIVVNVTIENYDSNFTYDFNYVLASSFKVDLDECDIIGLKDLPHVKLRNQEVFTEKEDIVKATDRLQSIYLGVENNIYFTNFKDVGILRMSLNRPVDLYTFHTMISGEPLISNYI